MSDSDGSESAEPSPHHPPAGGSRSSEPQPHDMAPASGQISASREPSPDAAQQSPAADNATPRPGATTPAEGTASPQPTPPAAPPPGLSVTRRRVLLGGAALLAAGVGAGAIVVNLIEHGASGVLPPLPGSSPGAPGETAKPLPSEPGALGSPGASGEDDPIESGPPAGPARVARENQLRGSRRWELPLTGTGDVEGYFGDASCAPGDQLTLHLKSLTPTVTVTVYRLGFYGGDGGRPVGRWKDVSVGPQLPETMNASTGLIRAGWSPSVTISVPGTWVSGVYVAVLEPAGGLPQHATFVLREASPEAPILMLSATSTHQAYNNWGGKSLYPRSSTGGATLRGDAGAVAVSWDRPYDTHRGAGLVMRWEYPFIRWVEAGGYDIAYAADMDLERHPEIARDRKLLVFVGHPEYWSVAMRKTLEAAIAAGTNVAWFSGNEMLWRTRYENLEGGQYRSVTCYRSAALDPLATSQPSQATTQWRDPPSPEPEAAVIGQMAGHIVLAPGDFVCSMPEHWLFAGTGMKAGDSISRLVGQEYDGFWPQYAPPNTQILSTSPVRSNVPPPGSGASSPAPGSPAPTADPTVSTANATMYTAASGATVFAAGTIQWSWGLDGWGNPEYEGYHTPPDRRVGIMTDNVLKKLGA